jgi:cytochrome oxidase assembly protein ShyY1
MTVTVIEEKSRASVLRKWFALGLVIGVAVLTGRLGLWQLDRADEKRELAQKRQLAAAKPAEAIEKLFAGDLPALEGRRLLLTVHQTLPNWYLDSRSYKGQAGMYVLAVLPLAPARLEQGDSKPALSAAGRQAPDQADGPPATHVLLLRGWQAKDPRQAQGIQERGTIQPGEYLLLRVEPEREHAASRFGLGSRVAGDHLRHWLAVDSQVMSEKSGLRLAPFVLRQLEAAKDAHRQTIDDDLIRDWPEPADGIDKHRAYALQWFLFCGLSLILALMMVIRWFVSG